MSERRVLRPEGEAMDRLRDGRAFLHRALVLSSLLLLASGEIFFEERFDGTTTRDSVGFPPDLAR